MQLALEIRDGRRQQSVIAAHEQMVREARAASVECRRRHTKQCEGERGEAEKIFQQRGTLHGSLPGGKLNKMLS